jgi:hypothetical protein
VFGKGFEWVKVVDGRQAEMSQAATSRYLNAIASSFCTIAVTWQTGFRV